MTDRHSGYIVVLENDLRDDDAEPILNAISQIRGVIDVQPIVPNAADFIYATRERSKLWKQIVEIFNGDIK